MTNNINLTKAQTPTPIDEPLFVLYREDVPDYKNINGWTLVLGGMRSGKSRYAESLVAAASDLALYIATAEARDAEMENSQ